TRRILMWRGGSARWVRARGGGKRGGRGGGGERPKAKIQNPKAQTDLRVFSGLGGTSEFGGALAPRLAPSPERVSPWQCSDTVHLAEKKGRRDANGLMGYPVRGVSCCWPSLRDSFQFRTFRFSISEYESRRVSRFGTGTASTGRVRVSFSMKT